MPLMSPFRLIIGSHFARLVFQSIFPSISVSVYGLFSLGNSSPYGFFLIQSRHYTQRHTQEHTQTHTDTKL